MYISRVKTEGAKNKKNAYMLTKEHLCQIRNSGMFGGAPGGGVYLPYQSNNHILFGTWHWRYPSTDMAI
jgi:hypothetical protein